MILEKMKNLKNHNSMKLKAVSEYYVKVEQEKDLEEIFKFINDKKLNFHIIGKGSNILFSKDFYKDTLVIDLKGLNKIKFDKEVICEAGVSGKDFLNFCIKNEIEGFEFLAGIPGTVGGFVRMNAGAFGSEISEFVKSIKIFDINQRKINNLAKDNLNFSYRNLENIEDKIILSINFQIRKGSKKAIKEKINNFMQIRKNKQPQGFNFGSVFKNGKDYYAGKLIEDCGLKGFNIGDAVISKKHANFIVNKGNAKGIDVLKLIETIEKKVKDKFGVTLKREVVVI